MSNLFVCPLTSGMSVVMWLEQWCHSSLLRVCELCGCRILNTVAGKISFFCEIWSSYIDAAEVSIHTGCYVRSWHWDRFLSECCGVLSPCPMLIFVDTLLLSVCFHFDRSPDGLIRPVGDAWKGGRMRQGSQTVTNGLVAKFRRIMLLHPNDRTVVPWRRKQQIHQNVGARLWSRISSDVSSQQSWYSCQILLSSGCDKSCV